MATSYDVGDVYPASVTVTDSTGALANAGAVTLTVTAPDGTTSTPTVSNPGTGLYQASVPLTMLGAYGLAWVATGTNASAFTDTVYCEGSTWAGLVSLAEAKSFLNITSSTNDEELRAQIILVSDAAEIYAGMWFRQRTVTKKFSPPFQGTETLLLEADAASVTSVTENGVTLTPDTQYSLDEAGVLWRMSSQYYTRSWISGHNNVVVTYVRGSRIISPALRGAVLEYLRDWWKTQRGPQQGMPPGGGSDPYAPETLSLPPRIREVLDNIALGGIG